jgi:hypothetical protein
LQTKRESKVALGGLSVLCGELPGGKANSRWFKYQRIRYRKG